MQQSTPEQSKAETASSPVKSAQRKVTYTFKTRPYAHQVRACKKALKRHGVVALFMEMGTGKTKVAIDLAGMLHLKFGVTRVFVACPLSVIGVWEGELGKHLPDNLRGKIDFRLMNYEKLAKLKYENEVAEFDPQFIICDESQKIKNAQAKRSKALHRLARHARFKLLLTGTPISKNPIDLFSQFKFLNPEVFGDSVTAFKRRYVVYGGYGGYKIIKYRNVKHMRRQLAKWVFQVKKQDCLDLPPRTHTIVPVTLPRKQRAIYDQMRSESVLLFSNEIVEAPIVLTRLLRMSQIVGGWVRGEGEYVRTGHAKQDVFRDLLETFWDDGRIKIVIFCRFLREVSDCADIASDIGYRPILFTGKTPKGKRDYLLARFDETKRPTAFIAQIGTGSLGISLTAASEAIFYSHSYSYSEFDQACDRLHRIGQTRKVTYYHLIGRDTVDEVVWIALRTKRQVAELVLPNAGRRPIW